jgi:hypothetical protein
MKLPLLAYDLSVAKIVSSRIVTGLMMQRASAQRSRCEAEQEML